MERRRVPALHCGHRRSARAHDVAQFSPKDEASSYYPPRSRWHTRILYHAGGPFRRHINLQRLRPSVTLSGLCWVLSLVVPGLAFLLVGRRLLGWLVLGAYMSAALVLAARLGYPVADIGYGLVVSLHATSIVFVESLWLKESRLWIKLVAALATLFAVWGLIYAPLVGSAEHRWLMPLRQGDRVFIVRRGVAANSIKRGDWLAYEISGDRYTGEREQGVYLGSGLGIDPVLALPGDRLRFTPQAVFVNDKAFPLAPHMPVQGELVVPEKVWFIWPTVDIRGHGRVTEASVSATLQQTAMVSQKQIIGRPFKRWFGRRQWP
jgi:hypothetical protein